LLIGNSSLRPHLQLVHLERADAKFINSFKTSKHCR